MRICDEYLERVLINALLQHSAVRKFRTKEKSSGWRENSLVQQGIVAFSPRLSTLRSGIEVGFTRGIAATEDGRGTSYLGLRAGGDFNPTEHQPCRGCWPGATLLSWHP